MCRSTIAVSSLETFEVEIGLLSNTVNLITEMSILYPFIQSFVHALFHYDSTVQFILYSGVEMSAWGRDPLWVRNIEGSKISCLSLVCFVPEIKFCVLKN